jgi:DNA-binding NarL/FixJ family response regulator
MNDNHTPITITIIDHSEISRRGTYVILGEFFHLLDNIGHINGLQARIMNNIPDVVVYAPNERDTQEQHFMIEFIRNHPQIAFVAIYDIQDGELFYKLMQAGVRAFLLQTARPAEMVEAINKAAAREQFYSMAVAQRLGYILTHTITQKSNTNNPGTLTRSEVRLVQLICSGYTLRDISELLEVNIRTLESRKNVIYKKLKVHSVTELVNYAVKNGLHNPTAGN